MAGLAHAAEAQISSANEEGIRQDRKLDQRPDQGAVDDLASSAETTSLTRKGGEQTPLEKEQLNENLTSDIVQETRTIANKVDLLQRTAADKP